MPLYRPVHALRDALYRTLCKRGITETGMPTAQLHPRKSMLRQLNRRKPRRQLLWLRRTQLPWRPMPVDSWQRLLRVLGRTRLISWRGQTFAVALRGLLSLGQAVPDEDADADQDTEAYACTNADA